MFPAKNGKQNEDDQVLDETELPIISNSNRNLTDSVTNIFDVRSQLDQQILNQESKETGRKFVKMILVTIFFYETTELNGSSIVKTLIGSSAILNLQNDDIYCFLWSILAHLYLIEYTKYGHPTTVRRYRQVFKELNNHLWLVNRTWMLWCVYKWEIKNFSYKNKWIKTI